MLDKAIPKHLKERDNTFYRDNYSRFIYFVVGVSVCVLLLVFVVFYQLANRPLPSFKAVQPDGKSMTLISFNEPNLLPDTVIRFASKAAVIAYSFDFVHYNDQLNEARPYFTTAGWKEFVSSINPVVSQIKAGQLIVNAVVAAPPVISNEGPLPGVGESWRIQVPLLVAFQSDREIVKTKYIVVITLIRVPTSVNSQGIGIDQFVTSSV